MRELIKRLILAFFCLGVMILALGLVWNAQGQERKGGEVQMPPRPLSDDALITMDFQDADLGVVIKFMGELTGKNFLVGDQVRGKVTIISPKKITVREAYKIFESVLEMNGYSAVAGGRRDQDHPFRRRPPVGPGDSGRKRNSTRRVRRPDDHPGHSPGTCLGR